MKILINLAAIKHKHFSLKKFTDEASKKWKINKHIFWLWNFVPAYSIVIIVCMIYNIEFVPAP